MTVQIVKQVALVWTGLTSACNQGCDAKSSYFRPDDSIMLALSIENYNSVSIQHSLIPRLSYFISGGSPTLVWVDFNYNGTELGTLCQPYNTLAEAIDAVEAGGEIKIKAGTTNETLTINKNVTIQSSGGTANIGE